MLQGHLLNLHMCGILPEHQHQPCWQVHTSAQPARECPAVTLVDCIHAQELEKTEGYATMEARRRSKFDKQIANGVLLSSSGLDEGIDRPVKAT